MISDMSVFSRPHNPLVLGSSPSCPLFKFPSGDMPEPDCCDLPDLVKTATPLPWTTGGPNDHSKPQQTASISPTFSVADPVYHYKNRVIKMK
jgi:hypothetical protein